MAELHTYDVEVNGYATRVKLTAEDAEKRGLTDADKVKVTRKSRTAANKSRTAANKSPGPADPGSGSGDPGTATDPAAGE
ncbi:hypothetical protein [Skermania piniformis]|uniref:Uncharacterized protein n=1 Tax=Skermania pinensis TaxID=39122 RepID=A0ABX8SCE0_9ACTN|nr:hypothetical protein [Skermania piniformis]QXQ14847.1 hypothetical protein KV203_05550 [Skermania piniformis]